MNIHSVAVKQVLCSPEMWPSVALVLAARLFGKSDVAVFREGFVVKAGTERGQGLWCAVAGSSYEPELRWLIQYLKPGDLFIDIGANIGIYSLHAARAVGRKGRIFSLEPGQGAFRLLSHNLERNGFDWAAALSLAASDQPGRMSFGGNAANWNSMSLISGAKGDRIVEVTTVDILCSENNVSLVNAIKIDAEGVEHAVIRGGESVIKRDKPAIIFERIYQSTANNPASILEEWGYRIFELPPRRGQRSPNLIAFHPENPRKVRLG